MKIVDIDTIYQRMPLDRIPWNSETPPDALVELVRSGKVKPCRAIDLGCGAGNYAIYLAGIGFDVTGVDSSPTAIRFAREKAERLGVAVQILWSLTFSAISMRWRGRLTSGMTGNCCIISCQGKGGPM